MKAIQRIMYISLLLFSYKMSAQIDVKDDSYTLRSDIGLNYNLTVKNNDTPFQNIKIFGVSKIGASAGLYNIAVIDSSFVHIESLTADSFSGVFTYKGKDSFGNIDSATVSFTRLQILPNVRPGDANVDNLVNHLDVFPLGLMYNRRGDPRHNIDTNTDFNVPKRVADWTFGVGGINGKHADIDGNSIIGESDFDKLKINLGQSAGTYSPKLSDTISTNSMQLNIQDTIQLSSQDSGKIKIPIRLASLSPITSYGLGFSLSIQNTIENSSQDTFYNQYKYSQPIAQSLWQGVSGKDLFYLEDKLSKANHTNLVYCRKDGKNGDIDINIGAIEVVVDVILWGKIDKTKYSRLTATISNIALIDNNYNTIPVKPISKYIYFKSATSSSIPDPEKNSILVYPTLIQDEFNLISNNKKPIRYTIYNSLGQSVDQNTLQESHKKISSLNWPCGIYYLKLSDSEKVYKLVKK